MPFAKQGPTTVTNAAGRLVLRFLACYALAATLAGVALYRGFSPFLPYPALAEFWLIPLALCAAFLTVSSPYLLALTAGKALLDAALVARMIRLVRTESLSPLLWNAGLALLLCSVPLFCYTAARAALFAFDCTARDLRLLVSKRFWLFLLLAAVLCALALPLRLFLPKILPF